MKLMLNGKEVSGMGHYVMAGDIKDATAEDSNVLSGKAFYNNNGKREGTMPNRGGMSAELPAGGSTTIPEGYHNGEGVVRAKDLASQTEGTMTAETLSVGETGWVNGKQITGSLVVPEVNDWDPEEMEEEVMLDLSGYTFKKYLNGSGSQSLTGGNTYIIVVAVYHDASVSDAPCIQDLGINFPVPLGNIKAFKIVMPSTKTIYGQNGYRVSVWEKA